MASAKKSSSRVTKKDLEAKIAELEKKLSQLSTAKPAEKPKPAETAKPAEKPKPAETAKPAEKPKPAAKPIWEQWRDSPTGNWNAQKAKTPGYATAPNRYYASRYVLQAEVPTQNWSHQKAKVPGYTAPSNKYFATRTRLAYSPNPTRFSGYGMQNVGASTAQTKAPPPKPQKGLLPKGF